MSDLVTLSDFTPEALLAALQAIGVDAELLESHLAMPTVPAAAAAIGVTEVQILKTLLFQDKAGKLVRVVASGPDRIDRRALGEIAGIGMPFLADPDTVLRVTGWPAGGVAPIGSRQPIRSVVDERVMALETVYGGGGTEYTLIRLRPADIVRLTNATVARLTEPAG